MIRIILFILIVIILNSCGSKVLNHANNNEAMIYLKANMEFLASDELQGREASTFGGYVAGRFITNQLKKYGIESHGEDGFFQPFKLQSTRFDGSAITIKSDDNTTDTLKFIENFDIYSTGDNADNSPVVFAGFGMIDSTQNINDYENIDVKGKTVVILRGIPEGYEGSRSASWTRTKSRNAQKAGAVGCIVIYSSRTMQFWESEIESAKEERIGRISSSKNINTIILDSLTTKDFFNMPAKTYAAIRKELEDGQIEKGSSLNKSITWQIKEIKNDHTARNIIGILNGTDPALANQYVTLSAHYDHVGIKGGQVYNGADDNASGTTSVLECARQLSQLKENKRPVLFCFWDAEEKGLLGSDYFASHYDSLGELVVNINLDMIGREHEDSLAVIGSGKLSSEFFNIVGNSNKETSNFVFDYTYDDENHPERLYYRSDHWSFAQRGIPAVFFFDAHDKDYHTPRDDADKINYLKLKKVVDLACDVVLKVANLDHKLTVDNANISGLDFQKKD